MADSVEISIVIPTRNGGERLGRCLEAICGQRTDHRFEVLCVDSESNEESLATMRRHDVRIERIPVLEFDHGLTRDLGARLSTGRALVFLNQDAVPCNDAWLERLVEPLFEEERWDAVQGGIRSLPPGQCFFWDSTEARFHFTRDMRRWVERYGGIGFSTVNAAIRRSAWEKLPFGRAVIMEDKKWQAAARRAGLEITSRPRAAVFHSHDYDWRSLARRCRDEGVGWRIVGERYSLRDVFADLAAPHVYRQWLRGMRRGRIRSAAELFYPWIRPIMLHVGNRSAADVEQ